MPPVGRRAGSIRSLRRLVGLPVRVGGHRAGAVGDVVLDDALGAAIGAVVESGDGSLAFLPWASTVADGAGLAASTPTAMLGRVELDYYLERGVPLATVRTLAVEDAAGRRSSVADVLVTGDGRTWALELRRGGRVQVVPFGEATLDRDAGRLSLRRRAA
jgi:hypothetical protein